MAVNTRRLALKIIVDIDVEGKYSNLALNKHLTNNELSNLDKRFIRQLVYGVLENKVYLDYIIKKFSKTPIRKMDKDILNILRLGIYQIKFLDKVPDSAAVNESVKIVKKINYRLSGFVNGILRNYIRTPEKAKLPSLKKEPIRYLSVKYSFEEWLVEKWVDTFGIEFTDALLKESNRVPKLYIRTNTLKNTRNELMETLKAEGCDCLPGKVDESVIILKNIKPIEHMDSFNSGFFTIQDASSMLVAKVLDPKMDELVLDLCSAPGGKTTHIAQLMNNTGTIKAFDIHKHKLELIKDYATRLGIINIDVSLGDATDLNNDLVGKADRVLVDAPCSGFGIVSRKPEIKYNKSMDDILSLKDIQKKILKNASMYLKDDGVMVYSTCTIMPEENQEIIKGFLEENPNFILKDINKDIPFITEGEDKYGTQLYPNVDDTDGFFIAKLIKKSV